MTKRGSSFGYIRVVILRGRVSYRTFLLGGVLISEGCSEDYMYLLRSKGYDDTLTYGGGSSSS